jgi:hypothetical protein
MLRACAAELATSPPKFQPHRERSGAFGVGQKLFPKMRLIPRVQYRGGGIIAPLTLKSRSAPILALPYARVFRIL